MDKIRPSREEGFSTGEKRELDENLRNNVPNGHQQGGGKARTKE